MSNVLTAIGIPNIGKNNAKLLAAHCFAVKKGNPLETFLELAQREFDWTVLDGFGEVMSAGINRFVKENLNRIRPLIDLLNIAVETPREEASAGLAGQPFCITGRYTSSPAVRVMEMAAIICPTEWAMAPRQPAAQSWFSFRIFRSPMVTRMAQAPPEAE